MKPISLNEGGRHITLFISLQMVRIYLFGFSATLANHWWRART